MSFRMSSRTIGVALGLCIAAVVTFGFISRAFSQVTFTGIPAANINQAQKALAERVADSTLKAWRAGQPAPMNDSTQQMKTALPPAKQISAYQTMFSLFGHYESVSFHEAVASPQMPGITVYRFRGRFTKGQPEVRVVIDHTNKVAGFWVKVWSDTMR